MSKKKLKIRVWFSYKNENGKKVVGEKVYDSECFARLPLVGEWISIPFKENGFARVECIHHIPDRYDVLINAKEF